MFQLEVLEGEEIYACNICNEGFGTDDKVKKSYRKKSQGYTNPNRKNMEEAAESSSNENCGYAWLARHDDDGNFIG